MMENKIIKESLEIYSKINELNSNNEYEKLSYIWRMGTDFFLHLARWENLLIYIKNLNVETDNILVKWEGLEAKKGYLSLYIDEQKDNNFVLGTGKDKYFYKFFENISDPNIKSMGESTIRQFIEFGISFGYLSWQKHAKSNEFYNIIFDEKELYNGSISKNNFNDFIESKLTRMFFNFDFISFGPQSNRDILLGIHIAFLMGYCKENNIDFMNTFGNLKIWERSSKKNIKTLNQVKMKGWNKHYDTQTTIKKSFEENNKIIREVLFKIHEKLYEKYTNGWESKKETLSYELFYNRIKNNYRSGQNDYRNLMLNARKRIFLIDDEYTLLRHDLSNKIYSPSLVEAAHLLDYRLCSKEEEKYDPENGLLLDPSLHKYLDKDILCFDNNGNVLVKKEFENEITEIFTSSFLKNKIEDQILTSKTKMYLEKRINERKINIQEYISL